VSIPTLDELRAIGAAQQPTYPDLEARDRVVDNLRKMPPLVFADGRLMIGPFPVMRLSPLY